MAPTHRIVKNFSLSSITLTRGLELDLSDGVLRLPPETITSLVRTGQIIALDPQSEAKRQIDAEATQARAQTEVDLRGGVEEINRRLGEDLKDLHAKYPDLGPKYMREKEVLEGHAYHEKDELTRARKATLAAIDAAHHKKLEELKARTDG